MSEETSDDEDWFEQGLSDDDSTTDDTEGTLDTDSEDDESPFDTGGESAFSGDTAEEGPSGGDDATFGDSDDAGFSADDSEAAFGQGDSAFGPDGDPFRGGSDESLFDDEGFASAFDGDSDSGFEDEDFDSEIPRIDLGIEGLDNMIQGGVPERHLMVTIGGAGTGKTTFGLQFLNHGLEQGENAVFITLEQSHEAIMATANEFGWEFEAFEDENRLAVVDLDPVEMANSLDNIQAELPELIRDFGADRLVLDSVSLLEMMYDNQANRRTEVFDFTRSLKQAGVTTFLTSEASETTQYSSRHGIIEYLTDAVFVLQYVRGETQETRLAVEIQKIRNANHSREMKPYEMTEDGLSVYQQANIF